MSSTPVGVCIVCCAAVCRVVVVTVFVIVFVVYSDPVSVCDFSVVVGVGIASIRNIDFVVFVNSDVVSVV